MTEHNKYQNIIRFILAERWLTITVIGSILTFQFVSSFKRDIIDPILDFLLPDSKFGFMNIIIKDGTPILPPDPQLRIDIGDFFRESIKYLVMLVLLYLLAKFTRFPESPQGNISGAAIM